MEVTTGKWGGGSGETAKLEKRVWEVKNYKKWVHGNRLGLLSCTHSFSQRLGGAGPLSSVWLEQWCQGKPSRFLRQALRGATSHPRDTTWEVRCLLHAYWLSFYGPRLGAWVKPWALRPTGRLWENYCLWLLEGWWIPEELSGTLKVLCCHWWYVIALILKLWNVQQRTCECSYRL